MLYNGRERSPWVAWEGRKAKMFGKVRGRASKEAKEERKGGE